MSDARYKVLGWTMVCAGVLAFVIALPQFLSELRQALGATQARGQDEHLENVETPGVPWLIEQKGGRWGRYGWYLLPGERGQLRIRLPGSEEGQLLLRIWAFSPGETVVAVSDGARVQEIPQAALDGSQHDLSVHGPSTMTLMAKSELGEEQLVLDRFAVSWFPAGDKVPVVWPVGLALVLALSGWAVIISHGGAPGRQVWLGVLIMGVAVTVAAELRFTLWDMSRGLPVDGDTGSYMRHARGLSFFTSDHGFYSGSFDEREPLHVAAVKLWTEVWGDTFQSVRLYTVVLSSVLVGVVGVFVWILSGNVVFSGVAAWVMALNPVLVEESVRGLRFESMTLLSLLVVSAWLWGRGWVGTVALGTTVGLAALLRTPALSIFLPLMWLAWLVNVWQGRQGRALVVPHHWTLPHLIVASVLSIVIFLPHLYGLYKVQGDPSWPSYMYARWNANKEFPERLGTEGFPTKAEYAGNSYAGPQMTYGEYMFGLHSIPELFAGQLKGWAESSGYMTASVTRRLKDFISFYKGNGLGAVLRHVTPLMVTLFVISLTLTGIGWLDLWRHSAYWWVPFLCLWGTWYAAYLYNVRLIESFRHTGHVYPLLLYCMIWGGYRLYQSLIMTKWFNARPRKAVSKASKVVQES